MYNVCKLGHATCSGRNVYENFPAKMAPLFIASRKLAVILKLSVPGAFKNSLNFENKRLFSLVPSPFKLKLAVYF